MELETVWHGALWREMPPPVRMVPVVRPVVPRPKTTRPRSTRRDREETKAAIMSQLESWRTPEALAYLTRRTPRQVRYVLDELLRTRYAERTRQQQGRIGRYLYRRRAQ